MHDSEECNHVLLHGIGERVPEVPKLAFCQNVQPDVLDYRKDEDRVFSSLKIGGKAYVSVFWKTCGYVQRLCDQFVKSQDKLTNK